MEFGYRKWISGKKEIGLILVKFLSLLSFLSEHIETKWNLTFSVLSRSEKLTFIFPRVSNSSDESLLFLGTYVFFNRVSAKFSGKNIKNFFPNPSTFGECGECKVVGVDLPETWNQTKNDSMIYFVPQRWTSFWQIFTHHETFSTGFCPSTEHSKRQVRRPSAALIKTLQNIF